MDPTDDELREFLAERGADELMLAGPPPDNADWDKWAQNLTGGPVMASLLAGRQFVQTRTPQSMRANRGGAPLPAEAMAALRGEYPKATMAGDMAFPIATALTAPGTMQSQAALAGALEFMREGSTLGSTAGQAGLAGLSQFGGNMATRVVSGAYRNSRAAVSNSRAITTARDAGAKVWRMLSEISPVGRMSIQKVNQRLLRGGLGRILGIDDLQVVNRPALKLGQQNINKLYDRALSIRQPVNVARPRQMLQAMHDDVVKIPGFNRINELWDQQGTSAGVRAMHTTLRKSVAKMRKSDALSAYAEDFALIVDDFEREAIAAGADAKLLKEAGKRWSVLKTIEETPDAWITGTLNPRQLASKFGRSGRKGFGTSMTRGYGVGVDDVDGFLDDLVELAADPASYGDSGTAARYIVGGGSIGGTTALLSGGLDVQTAGIGLLTYGMLPPVAGLASIGTPVTTVGKVAAGTATGANQ
jgi:hypothetical protein